MRAVTGWNHHLAQLPGFYVLVWSAQEAEQVYALHFETKPLLRGVLAMDLINQIYKRFAMARFLCRI